MHKLGTVCLLLLGWSLALAAAPAAHAADRLAPGQMAPTALGVDAQGRTLELDSLRGRVVLLSFWASWCAPCLEEMKVLENLQQRLGPQQLVVVGINWQESRRQFRRLVERLGPVALTLGSDPDGRIGEQYGVTAIPRLFLIDTQGRLAYSHQGYDAQTIGTVLLTQIAELQQATAASGQTPTDHAIMPP